MVVVLPRTPVRVGVVVVLVLGVFGSLVHSLVHDLANSTATLPPCPNPKRWICCSDHSHSSKR